MAEQQNTTVTPTPTDTGTGTGPQPAVRTFTQADLDRIAGEAREQGRKSAQKEAEEKALAERQEFKTLYEKTKAELDTLQGVKAQVDAATAAMQKLVDAELQTLPEDQRGLVPALYTPQQKLEWLAENKTKLLRPAAPSTDAGMRGDASKQVRLTPEEEEVIRKTGISREKYIANKIMLSGG
jgi:hypothetical protein